MPELPEVETVRRGLETVLVGKRVARLETRRPDLRFPLPERFAERIEGRRIEHLGRRSKYLVASIEGGESLVMHLGMSGRFTITPAPRGADLSQPLLFPSSWPASEPAIQVPGAPTFSLVALDGRVKPGHDGERKRRPQAEIGEDLPQPLGEFAHETGGDPKHDHVVFETADDTGRPAHRVTYNDPRRFGFMVMAEAGALETHPLIRDLGPEPLGNALTADYLAARAAGRKADLKAFLMDQRNIAGLGNIYVAEALFRAGLSPNRAAACLADAKGRPTMRAERLVPAIRDCLVDAIRAGGSTLRDYRAADGALGYFQHSFAVYGRAGEPCIRAGCGGTVRRAVQGGRSTFYCSRCQR